jgi:hypothetical protein
MDTAIFPLAHTRATLPKYICASEKVKLIGAINARFPDFGHHLEKEMGGLWLHPIKLLDGFWLRLNDESTDNVDVWLIADEYQARPWGSVFYFDSNLGHTNLRVIQRQMCPEEAAGLIVEYDIHNQGGHTCPVSLELFVRADIRPVWFSEAGGIVSDGQNECEWLGGLFLARDPAHNWYAALGTFPEPNHWQMDLLSGPENTNGQGLNISLFYSLAIGPNEHQTLRFYVAGSHISRQDCLDQYALLTSGKDFESAKRDRYEALLTRSRVRTPDARFDEIYDWVKINTDWLIMDTGVYGRGLAAGMPEYPWWFGCDNCYALQGVLAMGDFALVRDTLDLILRYSEQRNGNGRILHEITTAGLCPNQGNTQETAHFIVMVWLYYEWTGDLSLVERAFPYLQKSVAWLEAQDPENEGVPGGYGIIEIAGLNSKMIDTAVYTALAYFYYGFMCQRMKLPTDLEKYHKLSERTMSVINTMMWDEREGLYCDAFTSVDEVQKKKAAILEKRHSKNADKAAALLDAVIAEKRRQGNGKSGWLLNHNWVINTPMEMGIAPDDKARRALKKLHTRDYIGPYGMYLSGIYQDAVMTISTGAMAVAQARYGYADRALELIERIFKSFGQISPGCIAEMSPDYGCFIQSWTAYAVFTPVVRYFFGLQPQNGKLFLRPCMPSKWESASLTDAAVLDGSINLYFKREASYSVFSGNFTGQSSVFYELIPGRAVKINGEPCQPVDHKKPQKLPAGRFEIVCFDGQNRGND